MGSSPASTIWLFNIAMERSTIFKFGKPSISMGHLYHGYVSHNQRVAPKDINPQGQDTLTSFSASRGCKRPNKPSVTSRGSVVRSLGRIGSFSNVGHEQMRRTSRHGNFVSWQHLGQLVAVIFQTCPKPTFGVPRKIFHDFLPYRAALTSKKTF